MKIDTGGPAFPRPIGHSPADGGGFLYSTEQRGATLLDHFAGVALCGMLAFPGDDTCGNAHTNSNPKSLANTAYTLAAAMIAEKRRRESGN